MLLAANALLYLSALALAIVVTRPPSGTSDRGARSARAVMTFGGGLAVVAAIALAGIGMWFESALTGAGAIVVVSVSMWFALARMPEPVEEEDDEDDDGGGSLFCPEPPAPTKPEGGPSEDYWTDWSEFDAARSAWDREREPAGA
jgi:hypothetical protein